ncbi:MAG: hypothetical protein IJR66_04365 [Clostridia bacterium]|nr:hypothetical protein [Clostridia bacterium]
MALYKIADVIFDINTKYNYTHALCKNYLYKGEESAEYSFSITDEMIKKEKELAPTFPDFYLESLAVFRVICEYLLDNKQGIIFHSSAVAVDNEAYLFAAPSGTGKSTHARYWKELLGDKLSFINDDKPIIRYVDGEFYVYGTPWNGKHHLDTNCKVKIKAICALLRAEKPFVEKANVSDMLNVILNQTLRPNKEEQIDKLFDLIEKLLYNVALYKLGCNLSIDSAKIAYKTLSGGKNED